MRVASKQGCGKEKAGVLKQRVGEQAAADYLLGEAALLPRRSGLTR